MALMTKMFQYWARKNKMFSSTGNSSSGSKDKKEDKNRCFNCNKTGHFIAECPELS
ncbi:serine/threonine protein kinase SRPK1, partial [Trifolium medium]|nr:serine/threonine protein kinase SRPK1 [Trifolium medium]